MASDWMNIEEAAEHLRCPVETVKEMVNKKEIPFSKLVDDPKFFKKRLDDWLLNMETSPKTKRNKKGILDKVEYNQDLVEQTVERSGLEVEQKQKYFNLKEDRVRAQIHPPNPKSSRKPGGIELVIPEVDDEAPQCKILQNISIKDLYGNWRANNGWLTGDGTRYTFRPAAAYHILEEMADNPKHRGWEEVEALLEYAKSRTSEETVMKYRADPDLKFLRNCDQEDLQVLVEILTKTKKGNKRISEFLTDCDLYKKYYPDHRQYWHLIAAELQTFGAHSFVTYVIRGGKGVLYKQILIDVCKKLKVKYNKDDLVRDIESSLLVKILTDSMKKMDSKEIKQLVEKMGLPTTSFTKQGVTIALQTLIKQGGFNSYKIAAIVANGIARTIFGRGLSFGTNAALMKWIGRFAGPIGWWITGLWTASSLMGPSYRVTVPSLIQVAYMRSKMNESE